MNKKKTPAKKKKARLGRGLGALLGDVKQTTAPSRAGGDAQNASDTALRMLPIDQLQRGAYQPRLRMDKDALEELADSIRRQGVLQPILARRIARGKYEIIAGERRWRGAQLAGLGEVPAVVRAVDDQTAMAVALIENIQRRDLNALEQAKGFARLLDEFGLTHQEVAESVGCSRAAITNLLRLLKLHAKAAAMLEAGEIEMGHARALLALPEQTQASAAAQVATSGLSVRATEKLVKRLLKGRTPSRGNDKDADIAAQEHALSQKIGAEVAIQHNAKKQHGKLVIKYHSLDELDGILKRIQ